MTQTIITEPTAPGLIPNRFTLYGEESTAQEVVNVLNDGSDDWSYLLVKHPALNGFVIEVRDETGFKVGYL